MDKNSFFTEVLKGLGITPNTNNLAFLLKWSNYEKRLLGVGHGFNPLNTTKKVTGSTPMKGSINAGFPVQDYPTEAAGIQATVLTLQLPYYIEIVKGLKSGKNLTSLYNTPKIAANLKTWGTHTFAKNFMDYGTKPPVKIAKTPPVLIYILLIGLISYFCFYYIKY